MQIHEQDDLRNYLIQKILRNFAHTQLELLEEEREKNAYFPEMKLFKLVSHQSKTENQVSSVINTMPIHIYKQRITV